MEDQELSELQEFQWMPSRIPLRDAICTFVPDSDATDSAVVEMQARIGSGAWYPVEGGHRVLMPDDGQPFDTTKFTLESDAWDHEHCDICQCHIPAMTLCHVTIPTLPYKLLCAACFGRDIKPHEPAPPWWQFWRR